MDLQISLNKSEKEQVRFGDTRLKVNGLGIRRTRVIYAQAGGERGQERNYGFSPCLPCQKEWRVV